MFAARRGNAFRIPESHSLQMGWQKPRGTLSPCVIVMARLGELDCDRLREGALRYLAEMKETATQPGHDQPGWQTVLVDASVDGLRN